jgi:hypothetical protein
MLAIVASAIDRRTAVVGCDQTDHIMLNQRRVEMMRASGAHRRRRACSQPYLARQALNVTSPRKSAPAAPRLSGFCGWLPDGRQDEGHWSCDRLRVGDELASPRAPLTGFRSRSVSGRPGFARGVRRSAATYPRQPLGAAVQRPAGPAGNFLPCHHTDRRAAASAVPQQAAVPVGGGHLRCG